MRGLIGTVRVTCRGARRNAAIAQVPAGAAVVLVALLSGFTLQGDDFFYRLNKGIDVYGRVYREVSTNYVDEIDPLELMEAGIDGMLASLDPYTNFINDEEGDEVELITSGRYGGIGVTVGTRDGHITIMSVMDGYSAQKQGLIPGDRVVRIDNKAIADLKPSEVRVLTRGTPGTEVRLVVERDGEDAPLEFILVREEIRLRNVSYSGMMGDGIGYIRLERFSRDAGDEIALALKDFRLRDTLRGVVLDLRNNPGGLLDAAVDVVGKFLPKGSLIVSTQGEEAGERTEVLFGLGPAGERPAPRRAGQYNSASASEIVAAAVQDLDRGVILGTRSFGKGLVQTVTPLVYNTQLKITTAKYYTPSGRCLQEIDYANGGVKDTATAKASFKTSKGRSEFAHGGVAPDTVVEESKHSPVYGALMRQSMFFRFAAGVPPRTPRPGRGPGHAPGEIHEVPGSGRVQVRGRRGEPPGRNRPPRQGIGRGHRRRGGDRGVAQAADHPRRTLHRRPPRRGHRGHRDRAEGHRRGRGRQDRIGIEGRQPARRRRRHPRRPAGVRPEADPRGEGRELKNHASAPASRGARGRSRPRGSA